MIRPLDTSEIDAYLAHADRQGRENGRGATLRFALRPPSAPRDLERIRRVLETGLTVTVGKPGWCRLWIDDGQLEIRGSVGLRAHSEQLAFHRALIDIGVLEPYRRAGVATALMQTAIAWAANQPQLAWLDSEIFAHNEPALRLHARLGFVEAGRVTDMFRLDGAPTDDVRLVLDLARNPQEGPSLPR